MAYCSVSSSIQVAADSFIPLFLVFVSFGPSSQILPCMCVVGVPLQYTLGLLSKLGKNIRFPMFQHEIHIFPWHPPLQEEKEETIDDENSGIDQPREWTQRHRPTSHMISRIKHAYSLNETQNAPSHSRLKIDGFRSHDNIVHCFRPLSDAHPVVETFDACVCFKGIMITLGNDLDRFGECAEDVC